MYNYAVCFITIATGVCSLFIMKPTQLTMSGL